MTPGPLPHKSRARRNPPTVPTTNLPAGGRRGETPDPPKWIELGKAGRAWWDWAWSTPQAVAWDDGELVTVAHRASIEDDLWSDAHTDLDGLVNAALDATAARQVRILVGRLATRMTGRARLLRQAGELDDKLGLSPKAREQLRFVVVADEEFYAASSTRPTAPLRAVRSTDRRRRLLTDGDPS